MTTVILVIDSPFSPHEIKAMARQHECTAVQVPLETQTWQVTAEDAGQLFYFGKRFSNSK